MPKINCDNCSDLFYKSNHSLNRDKTHCCSTFCRKQFDGTKTYNCCFCNKPYDRTKVEAAKSLRNYCSKSCSAKVTNSERSVNRTKYCIVCGVKSSNKQKYCSPNCKKISWDNKKLAKFDIGKCKTNHTIRIALIIRYGEVCSLCKTTGIWNGKAMTLQVDHIDGDSDNNAANNCRLVCPNCHSQLDTSKPSFGVRKETKRNRYLRKYKK